MPAVVDTNVLIYDAVEDSKFHEDARNLLDRLERWLIPTVVVYEFVWFFRGCGLDANETEELLGQYVSSPKCRVVPDGGEFTRRAFELLKGQPLSRFNDMVVLATAEKYRALVTFDRKLQSRAKELGVVTFP